MSIITVDVVTHTFRGAVALDHLSLGIDHGITGLLGPNGAGKTTLMRLLATIYKLQSGDITLLETSLHDDDGRRTARTQIGYLPQNFGFYPNFTVTEFVEYFAILRGVSHPHIDPAVSEALERVDMASRAKQKMKSLSGGMVRRVGIAQAIAHRPKFLILDEPTAGLDPDQRYQLRESLRDLAADTTILISTHLAEDIAALGGQVLVMNEGSLRFDGTTAELALLGGNAPLRENDMRTPIEKGYSVAQARPAIRPGSRADAAD